MWSDCQICQSPLCIKQLYRDDKIVGGFYLKDEGPTSA